MKLFLLHILFILSLNSRDFTPSREDSIHDFLLHNYDQLIYECFTKDKTYFRILAKKLTDTEKEAEYIYSIITLNNELCHIQNPPHFLYKVNDILKASIINKSFIDR